jgi:hypothetical protein
MSKPANIKQGKAIEGKKLATKQEAAIIKAQKNFRRGSVNVAKEIALQASGGAALRIVGGIAKHGAKYVTKAYRNMGTK